MKVYKQLSVSLGWLVGEFCWLVTSDGDVEMGLSICVRCGGFIYLCALWRVSLFVEDVVFTWGQF